ncbi:hypothetical protein WJX79_009241 [Trebouxia sp. C0005]
MNTRKRTARPHVKQPTLTVAGKALQGQLDVCSKQPAHSTYAGYTSLQGKQRLEYQPGDAVLGDLGVLQQLVTTVIQLLDNDARGMMVHLARVLHVPATCFLQFLGPKLAVEDQLFASSLEAINYALPANSADPNGCQSHVDKGLLTLIHSDSSDGLQVLQADGQWAHMRLPEGCIAVLAGHTLERATCGLVKAAKHRVVMGHGGCSTARTALVYKFRASEDAVLDLHATISKHHTTGIDPRRSWPQQWAAATKPRDGGLQHAAVRMQC